MITLVYHVTGGPTGARTAMFPRAAVAVARQLGCEGLFAITRWLDDEQVERFLGSEGWHVVPPKRKSGLLGWMSGDLLVGWCVRRVDHFEEPVVKAVTSAGSFEMAEIHVLEECFEPGSFEEAERMAARSPVEVMQADVNWVDVKIADTLDKAVAEDLLRAHVSTMRAAAEDLGVGLEVHESMSTR